MKRIYEHQITNGNHAEAISVETDAENIRVAVTDTVRTSPFIGEIQVTSIDLSPEGVAPLVEALLQSISEDGHVVLKLTGVQLRQIITALAVTIERFKSEVSHADTPHDLLAMLRAEFDALLERDKKSNKDN